MSLGGALRSTFPMADPHFFDDEIEFSQQSSQSVPGSQRLLIYFLPGNPGVVQYYRHFLSDLHDDLSQGPQQFSHITTYGHSHDGFELSSSRGGNRGPFTLGQTIDGVKRRLLLAAANAGERVRVILIGHSVGSYMLMELVSWWQQSFADDPQFAGKDFELVGGVCLFPTVVDLAQSPRGKVMSWLLAIPFLHLAAQFLARILSQFVPPCVFAWPKAFTPGEDPAQEYIELTKATLESPRGAGQAAYLAADEMRVIKEDRWHPSLVWGAQDPSVATTEASMVKAGASRTKLFFYWGEDDYWVDNGIRDRLIKQRAGQIENKMHSGRPTMMIDGHKMDHCFSLNREHGQIVARQVAEWIRGLKINAE